MAARTASYAEPAVQLGLTHGAISKQFAAIESWLGQRLFVRTGWRGDFDIAIRQGLGNKSNWPQYRAVHFLDKAGTLIVSPSLYKRTPLLRPSDVANHILLSSETRSGDWADWLERAGPPLRAEQRRRMFDHFTAALQAVIDGLGIGIGRIGPLPVLQTDLSAG